ncbi:DUF1659 domain-containing protein [Alkalibacillus salilacus]|uniref:DUF1659 domain-containing protein n=1 Tax=Alkalibacillus salilacus TaxID=284582 RepID=A0ABT9VGG3_9BACI|nr:DUF1659 domain-containing protein [Alkalibacillus salilacus]MDQ0160060.1 hypothetical protein [Alkalibacillus salilacus]
MAEKIDSQLQLVYQTGLDEEGNSVFQTRRYNNVKPDATNDSVIAVAQVLSNLCDDSLSEAIRQDDSLLVGTQG